MVPASSVVFFLHYATAFFNALGFSETTEQRNLILGLSDVVHFAFTCFEAIIKPALHVYSD